MLLGEEQPRPVALESLRPDQSVNRAVSFRHVQSGRLIVFFPYYAGNRVLPERNESGRDASLRMLLVQFVSPNRIELIQLIVQGVTAIFS